MKAEQQSHHVGNMDGVSAASYRMKPRHLSGLMASLVNLAKENTTLLIMAATLVTAAQQAFFLNYRTAVFNIISYDDYQNYLLFILSEPGGKIPLSPWTYRIGSVIMAAPFYDLPVISLSGGPIGNMYAEILTPSFIRATQAMCVANLFYLSLSCILVFIYGRTKLRLPDITCFIGAVLLFVLFQLTALASVDGIAALPLTIVAIAVFERMRLTFALAVLASAFINEKIVLVAFLMVALRLLFSDTDRRFYLFATGICALSLLAYVSVVYILHFPGNANHTEPLTYLGSIWKMLKEKTFTAKGVYLNLWPILLLVGLWLVGMMVPRRLRLVTVSDVGVILGMLLIAFALGVNYTVGRIVLYSAPIFVIAAMPFLVQRHLVSKAASDSAAQHAG